MQQTGELKVSILGDLRVNDADGEVSLPASRKARALLGFLLATGRPHRRERLCELFWDIPDDPKASLRWALSKLRKVLDTPMRARIVADRERVALDDDDLAVDLRAVRDRLRGEPQSLSLAELEDAASRLSHILLDGLDGAGDEAFDSWLAAERQDVATDRITVLRRLACHPDASGPARDKWNQLLREADPFAEEIPATAADMEPARPAAQRLEP